MLILLITTLCLDCKSAQERKALATAKLFKAIDTANINMLYEALNEGPDINRIRKGQTPLTLCIKLKYNDFVKVLIRNNANVFYLHDKRPSPFLIFIFQNNLQMIKEILKIHGNKINRAVAFQSSALMMASFAGKKEIVKLLLDAKANVHSSKDGGWNALMGASDEGYLEIVKMLVNKGADVNAKTAYYKRTVLMRSIYHNQTKVVEYLIDKGADVNAVDRFGITPMHFAAQQGNKDIIKLLLKKQANINAKDKYGRTPLRMAKNAKKKDIILYMKIKNARLQ
jgi:ankyrin repeat protein